MKYKVYCIENKITNKLYIGYTNKSINERLDQHIKNAKSKINRRLYDSMNHYGYDNFSISKIDECETQSKVQELESWYIYLLDSKNPDKGYNMTWGGDGGYTLSEWSESERKKLYKRQQKNRESYFLENYDVNTPSKIDWVRKRISESSKGKIISDKHRESISKTLKEKYESGELVANTVGLRPHKVGEFNHSEESKKKMSEFRTGKSYEDIYDLETANRIKKEKSKRWSGYKNPNYKPDLTDNESLKFIQLLIDNKKMSECSKILGHSEYKLRKFLRSVGIKNIQKLRNADTENKRLTKLLEKYE